MQRRHWRDVKVTVLPILNLGARREWSTLCSGCFSTMKRPGTHWWSMGQVRRGSARSPNLQGAIKVTGIIGNMVVLNSGFHMRKNFSDNYLKFGYTPSKVLAKLLAFRDAHMSRVGADCTRGWVGLRAGLNWSEKPSAHPPSGVRASDRPARSSS